MTAALVALQRQLIPAEDHGRDRVLGARLRRQQRDRLVGDALGVHHQVPAREDLPPTGVLIAEPVGIRSDLQLAVPHRFSRDAAADLGEALRDFRALARHEQLVLAPDRVRGARRAQALALAHPCFGGHEQLDAVVERHREGVEVHRRFVRCAHGLDRSERGVALLGERGRLRDLDRQRTDTVGLRRAHDLGCGETPSPISHRAYAEAERVAAVDGIEAPVLHERVLLVAAHEADVRVRGAARPRRIERALREIALRRERGNAQALIR